MATDFRLFILESLPESAEPLQSRTALAKNGISIFIWIRRLSLSEICEATIVPGNADVGDGLYIMRIAGVTVCDAAD